MNEIFRNFIETLEPSYQRLMEMKPVTVSTLPKEIPSSGIYLFSEDNLHLYVGRTNTIRKRLKKHCYPSSGHNAATFAFRLARDITGQTTATYKEKGSRQYLQKHPAFEPIFIAQKERVKKMSVRFISEPDPVKQALLEMYISVSLTTPHNDFDNH
ncbi:MAG: GIY-YIG nuclease family protein [Deltaproteobacteria bacterium]|nr:GIY-YIG nuclease family protein [Deltaproteobacteria bacterium]